MAMCGQCPAPTPKSSDRSVLQGGSKGPLPQGACDSQPLAQESMVQAVSMPHHVTIYRVRLARYTGRPVNTLRARHPPWWSPAEPPLVTAAVRVQSTLHCTTVSPVLRLRQWQSPDPARVPRGNRSTVSYVVALAGYLARRVHTSQPTNPSGIPTPHDLFRPPPPPPTHPAMSVRCRGRGTHTSCMGP